MDTLPHEKQISEYLSAIDHLKKQENSLFTQEIAKLEGKLDQLKETVYTKLTPWQRVTICRHPQRPHTLDYITHLCDSFIELHGDRLYGDDPAVVGGLARIQDMKCVIIGQEKGNDTESRVKRNFGMLHPEGFRKVIRIMLLAEKFRLPIITLLDTPGAYPGLEAEMRGQGQAIANNILQMFKIASPMIVIVIGEGCSGGALGMGVGDVIAMLEHSYYSVISPEGCASILWKDASKNIEAASQLQLTAEHLEELNIIDAIIKEPLGGAHHDPSAVYAAVKSFVYEKWQKLRCIPQDQLLKQRFLKFRKMGKHLVKM